MLNDRKDCANIHWIKTHLFYVHITVKSHMLFLANQIDSYYITLDHTYDKLVNHLRTSVDQ